MLALAKLQILSAKPAPKESKWSPKALFAKATSSSETRRAPKEAAPHSDVINLPTSGPEFQFRRQHVGGGDVTDRFSGQASDDLCIIDLWTYLVLFNTVQ